MNPFVKQGIVCNYSKVLSKLFKNVIFSYN